MNDGWNAPTPPGSGIEWESVNGALLLFSVLSQEHGVQTLFGDKDPIKANVAVLDGAQAGEVYDEALVFPTMLIGQLKSSVGGKVLARLTQGTAKPGQKPPWILDGQVSEDDKNKARAFLNGQLETPAPAQQPAPAQTSAPPF